MFAVLALILFILSWVLHAGTSSSVPAWLDWRGLALLGMASMAAHLIWPIGRRQ